MLADRIDDILHASVGGTDLICDQRSKVSKGLENTTDGCGIAATTNGRTVRSS